MDSETHPNTRVFSSLSQQGWPRVSPSHAPLAGPAHADRHATPNNAAAYRATGLHQRTTTPNPPFRPAQANTGPERPSTTPTRPVLVRAYSGDADKPSRPSTMSRRFFPFSGTRSPAPRPPQPEIIFPSDKDFSIESILQAIEPDIRGTLDSIAEICGRSKLSLANEYGSHIAPLGEICAPPTLGPVEEASPSEELRGEDGNPIVLDESNAIDSSGDMHPFSFHRYLENLRHTASMMEQDGRSGHRRPGSPRSPGMDSEAETVFPITEAVPTPFTREFTSVPRHGGCDLLAKNAAGAGEQGSSQMATSAVVSEVYLEVGADDGVTAEYSLLPAPALGDYGSSGMGSSGPEIIQSLLGWIRWAVSFAEPSPDPGLLSAEDRLRAMLGNLGSEGVASTQ